MADIYDVYKVCGFCGGSGYEDVDEEGQPVGQIPCHVCDGEGRWPFGVTEERDPIGGHEAFTVMKTCGYCGGSGMCPDERECPLCTGTGKYPWGVQIKRD